MKEKLFYWLGSAPFAIASVVLAFMFTDWQIACCAFCCYIAPFLLILTDNKLKPIMWFLYAAGMFLSVIFLIMDCHFLLLNLPLCAVIFYYIFTQKRQDRNIIKSVLILMAQVMMGLLLLMSVAAHKTYARMDNTPYTEQTISSIETISQTYAIIKFESSDNAYYINQSSAELLKEGDKVRVKVNDDNIWEIYRL